MVQTRPIGTKLSIIAFDADDTLWQNEQFFRLTHERFATLLADFAAPADLSARLHDAELRNLGQYGFGIKGFTLSIIETAIDVTDGRVSASVIKELIDAGQDMLRHPIHLLPHAQDVVRDVAQDHCVLLITKGDLLDQERKLAQSGLGDLFDAVEIVSDKTPAVYREIFTRHGVAPDQVLMAGNSMRSDVVPVIRIGGWAVHVPHDLTWAYETDASAPKSQMFREIPDLGHLLGLLMR